MVVAAREEAYAKVEQLKRLGRFKEGATAEEVLLQEISRSAGAVAVLDDMVSELDEDAMLTLRGQTLIDTWNEQRRLLVQVGKTVLQAGVAERQVQIAEMQANALVACLLAVIGAPEMALSAEQQSMARRLMATQLRELPVAQVAS